MLARSGEQMPPWGVPSVGNMYFLLSRIPAFSHALICLLILGKVLTFSEQFDVIYAVKALANVGI